MLPLPDAAASRLSAPRPALTDPSFVLLLRELEAATDELDLVLGRPDALLRLFLERVEDINRSCKSDRVNRPIRPAIMIGDDFDDPTADPFQRLCSHVLAAKLRLVDRESELIADCHGETAHHSQRRADPEHRVERRVLFGHHAKSSISGA